MYDPANSIFVAYAPETDTVTESTDGVAAPAIADLPENFAICGMLNNTPDIQRGLNNAFGWAVGSSKAVYKKRGARNPEMSLPLKVTNIGLLQYSIRDPLTLELPRLAFLFGRPNAWTIAVRDCKINTAALSGKQNTTGEANEIELQIGLMACYTHSAAAMNIDARTLLKALGDPYFWHDTRHFKINTSAGVPTDYRRTMTSWSLNINHNLSRRGLRNNHGDNNWLSNTNEYLAEGNEQLTGEVGFNEKLNEALLTGAIEAQNWGNITTLLSNVPAVATGGKKFLVTMGDCMPQTANMPGVEANAQLASTIPFLAQSVAVTVPT